MNINLPNWNWNQYKAAGKHVASYAAGGVTVAVAFHFISPTDASGINENLGNIYSGVAQIAKGVAGLAAIIVPLYTSLMAAHNADPKTQAAALEKAIPGTIIVTTPEIAAATPNSPNVISNTEVKVISK